MGLEGLSDPRRKRELGVRGRKTGCFSEGKPGPRSREREASGEVAESWWGRQKKSSSPFFVCAVGFALQAGGTSFVHDAALYMLFWEKGVYTQ